MLLHILSIPELNLKEHSSDKVHPINGSKRKWLALLSTRWVTMEEYDFHEMTTKRKEPIWEGELGEISIQEKRRK